MKTLIKEIKQILETMILKHKFWLQALDTHST